MASMDIVYKWSSDGKGMSLGVSRSLESPDNSGVDIHSTAHAQGVWRCWAPLLYPCVVHMYSAGCSCSVLNALCTGCPWMHRLLCLELLHPGSAGVRSPPCTAQAATFWAQVSPEEWEEVFSLQSVELADLFGTCFGLGKYFQLVFSLGPSWTTLKWWY